MNMKTTRRVLLGAALAGAPLLETLLAAGTAEAGTVKGAAGMPAEPAVAVAAALKKLKPDHPRLIVTDAGIVRIKTLIQTDATAKRYWNRIVAAGTALLTAPPVEYVLIGPRLLDKSRTAQDRIYTLSLLYLMDGDKKWRDRAVKEMLAVCAFPDWHPVHFLDTAEMTHGVAVGYDWLYPTLSGDEKAAIRAGIVNYGLQAGVKSYKGGESYSWWPKAHNNWNQVCNGGITMGALAVADEEPALAQYILTEALKSLPLAMSSFAPDGGWNEGPAYWGFTVRYCVTLMAAMQTSVGTEFGISTAPGFDRTGTFRLYTVGPTGKTFNYSDGSWNLERSAALHWMADRFHQPIYDWQAEQPPEDSSILPLDLLWYKPATVTPGQAHAPLDNVFRNVDVALFRSAWDDPNALWAGFKGGDNHAPHAHLDLGSFVFEALGERWVNLLGSDNYNLPDYFGKLRYTYYRLGTEGANTALIDSQNQDEHAKAPLLAYASRLDRGYAVADLTEAYKPLGVTKLHRGVALTAGRKALLVVDEWTAKTPIDYQWQIQSSTSIKLAADGRSATLTRNGKTVRAFLLDAPAGAHFAVASATTPPLNGGVGPQQSQNRGIQRFVVRLAEKAASGRVAVLLSPGEDGPETVDVPSLDEWIKQAGPLPKVGGVL